MARAEDMTVLVVDDERDVLLFLQSSFEDAGFTVLTASDGNEALEQLENNEVHFISLDLVKGLDMMVEHHRFAVAGVRRPIPHESWYQVSGYFYLYGYAYAGMVAGLIPKAEQERLWPKLMPHLLKCRQPDGSFWDYPLYGFHKAYGTGFALMALAACPEEIARKIEPAGR